jgi:hypothetical protein
MMQRRTAQEAIPFLASKWLHLQFLLEVDELAQLLTALGPMQLFSTMGVMPIGKSEITKESFLDTYGRYVAILQRGELIDDALFRFAFTSVMTASEEALQALDVRPGYEIIRPCLPVIQLQLHRFDYSKVDGKFRPMVFGQHTISWGLQASYPQLMQDPVTRKTLQPLDPEQCANATLFRALQQWIRHHTQPTPFKIADKKVMVPIRIGKGCFNWIHAHKELRERGLEIWT